VTRFVCKKIAQNVANPILANLIYILGKKVHNIFGLFLLLKKPAQSKQLPNGQKFAPSGHPARKIQTPIDAPKSAATPLLPLPRLLRQT
jgi:hypothetical protein